MIFDYSQLQGFRANIKIHSSCELVSLANQVSQALLIPDFHIEHAEQPPYNIVASNEVLGSELWLEKSVDSSDVYLLSMESEHCFASELDNPYHDVSLWLARFLSDIAKLDVSI